MVFLMSVNVGFMSIGYKLGNTLAQDIAFTLPVSDVAGLVNVEETE